MPFINIIIVTLIITAPLAAYAAKMPELDGEQLSNYKLVESTAMLMGVPRELALAMAEVESEFRNVRARGGDAYGPLQVHSSALRQGEHVKMLLDSEFSVRRGIEVMIERLKQSGWRSVPARMMYVCGRRYSRSCSKENLIRIEKKWSRVMRSWNVRSRYDVLSTVEKQTNDNDQSVQRHR